VNERLKILDLFSGIGGFSLGLENTGGFETVAFCEIEEFPRRVLRKHWPKVKIYEDVRELTAEIIQRDGITIDAITRGFPCQDISIASGRQAGIGEGTRSGLWSECIRLIGELRPEYAIFENSPNLLAGPPEQQGRWFSRILCDLAEVGYDAEWDCIPASILRRKHKRVRTYFVAYPSQKQRLHKPIFGQAIWKRLLNECYYGPRSPWDEAKPRIIRVDDGVRNRVQRSECLGNTVVPKIPEMIGYAILEARKNPAQ